MNCLETDEDIKGLKVGDTIDVHEEECTVVFIQPYVQLLKDSFYARKRRLYNGYPLVVIQQDKLFGVLTSGDEIGDFWGCTYFGSSIIEALAHELQSKDQWHYM